MRRRCQARIRQRQKAEAAANDVQLVCDDWRIGTARLLVLPLIARGRHPSTVDELTNDQNEESRPLHSVNMRCAVFPPRPLADIELVTIDFCPKVVVKWR